MDLSKVRELIELMNRHQLGELEIEHEGFRVRLAKQGETVREVVTVPAAGVAVPSSSLTNAGGDPSRGTDPAGAGIVITSPMVGTFYRSPNPEAAPFAEVGDRIEEGQVLCIIEAMKVMNEVKAELSGTIEAILVDNGDTVEFGQTLFRLS